MSGYALAIIIFVVAALSDIVDGQLARRRKQVSTLGKFLDPIADKLLISAALIVLVEKHLAPSWAIVVILGREFIITGLRSVAASEGIVIQAQSMGKLKMWAQCVAVVALLVAAANGTPPVSNFGLDYPAAFWEVPEVQTAFSDLLKFTITSNDWKVFGYLVGRGALWVAVITAVWSMYGYFAYFLKRKIASEPRSIVIGSALAQREGDHAFPLRKDQDRQKKVTGSRPSRPCGSPGRSGDNDRRRLFLDV